MVFARILTDLNLLKLDKLVTMKTKITHLPEGQPHSISFDVKSSIAQQIVSKPNLVDFTVDQEAGNANSSYGKVITRSYYGFWKV
jgi:hypothetical protein